MREGWKTHKLREVCEIIAGQSPEGKYYNNTGYGLPFYQGKKEFEKKHIGPPTTWTSKVTKEALAGDILMSVRAPVGPVNFSSEKICIGRGLAAIRATEKIDREYLFYFLLLSESKLTGNSGAVFNSINKTQIGNIEIPLPNINIQRKIVGLLDSCFTSIDKAKANLEQSLLNAQELLQSKLDAIFSQRGEGWEEKKLGELCIVERGSSPRPIKNFLTGEEDGVNWIKIGDVAEGDKYVTKTSQKITPKGALKSRFVDVGDLILSNSMSYGRPYIMSIQGYIHDGWFVLRLPKELDPEYFWQVLASPYVKEQFESLAAGAIVKNIGGDLVKKASIPFPPIAIQKEVVMEINSFHEKIKVIEKSYRSKIASLEELKKSILQKAFSGELTKKEVAI